jgi:hypothetical protein
MYYTLNEEDKLDFGKYKCLKIKTIPKGIKEKILLCAYALLQAKLWKLQRTLQ